MPTKGSDNKKEVSLNPEEYGEEYHSRINRIKIIEKLDTFSYKTLEEFYLDYEVMTYLKENYDSKEDWKYIISDEIIHKFKLLLKDFLLRNWGDLVKKMNDNIKVNANEETRTSFRVVLESFSSEISEAIIEVWLNSYGKLVIVEKERVDDWVYETEDGDIVILTYNPNAISPSRRYRRDYEVSVNWVKQQTIDSTRLRNWWDTFVSISEDSDDGFRFIVNPTDEDYSQWNDKRMSPFQFE